MRNCIFFAFSSLKIKISNICVDFCKIHRYFVLFFVSGSDDNTPSVKGCFWLGYAVLGSIAWVKIDVKTLKTKLIRLF